jgi:hypothetical protein
MSIRIGKGWGLHSGVCFVYRKGVLRDQDISAQDCQDMAASLTLKDIAVVMPVSFSHTEAVFLVGTTTSLFHPCSRQSTFCRLCNVKPEIFLFLHLPRVSTLSGSQTGVLVPLTPLSIPPSTRYPYPLSKNPHPVYPSTSSTHILNPTSSTPHPQHPNHSFTPYLSAKNPPIPSVLLPHLQTSTCYLREGSGSLSLVPAGRIVGVWGLKRDDLRWLGFWRWLWAWEWVYGYAFRGRRAR